MEPALRAFDRIPARCLNTEGANIPDHKRTLGLGHKSLSDPILNTCVKKWVVTDNHPSALSQFTFRKVENMPNRN
jgi:hypothetical protein